ncbi:DUF4192 domain-containing protein [Nocardia colli]|uniref:DUF4192 domain-containing protein n=1 Tax=Nocardia colli TaxID=2545717 RepID=A0A5N0DXU7_9NOCA|nr:DUF4192 domain-containing protein [Nocardia colli]KAA8880381.1 DUF4192 domain-containing protein [Nocardia colli]
MSSSRAYLEDPGEIIAAIPAMLGFVPERSLLVVVLKDSACDPPLDSTHVFAVMRFDLDLPAEIGNERAELVAAAVTRLCISDGATEVLAVVIDDRATVSESDSHTALITDLALILADREIGLLGSWATAAIEPGSRWWSLLGRPAQGVIPDPKSSVVTAMVVAKGQPLYASRSGRVAAVQPDHEAVERIGRLLPAARAAVRRRYAVRRHDGDPDGGSRWGYRRVLGVIAACETGHVPTDRESAEIAAVLADHRVRDGLLSTGLSNYRRSAESLWTHLTRTLPGPQRAEAAVLLAYSAYVRGDGVLAGIALQTALDADPYHDFAIMLAGALEIGLDPFNMRQLARHGTEIVRDLGIQIDPPEGSS